MKTVTNPKQFVSEPAVWVEIRKKLKIKW